MGGPRGPQAIPNRWSRLGLSPRQFAKRVGVNFSMAQFVVFGRECQHQPSGPRRKARIPHSILATTGQETNRPQAKPQGRKSEPCVRVRPSHQIMEHLNRKRSTQGKLKVNPRNRAKDMSGVFHRKHTSTSMVSRNGANKASQSSKKTMHPRQSLHPRTLGPGRTHVLGVHRSQRRACWKRPIAQ